MALPSKRSSARRRGRRTARERDADQHCKGDNESERCPHGAECTSDGDRETWRRSLEWPRELALRRPARLRRRSPDRCRVAEDLRPSRSRRARAPGSCTAESQVQGGQLRERRLRSECEARSGESPHHRGARHQEIGDQPANGEAGSEEARVRKHFGQRSRSSWSPGSRQPRPSASVVLGRGPSELQ